MAKKKKKASPSILADIAAATSSALADLIDGEKKKKKTSPSPIITDEDRAAASKSTRKSATAQDRKDLNRALKTRGFEADPSIAVLGDEERAKASKSTRKSATKKDRRELQQALKEARAFRGTKKPDTKAERRLAAKGKEVRQILQAGTKGTKQDVDSQALAYQDVSTPALRDAKLKQLRKSSRQLEKDLKTSGKKVSGGVVETRNKAVKRELDLARLGITELKSSAIETTKSQVRKNITKLEKFEDKEGIPQRQVKSQLDTQRKGLRTLNRKREELEAKENRQTRKVQKSQKLYKTKVNKAFEEGLDDAGDIDAKTFLREKGIRYREQKGKGQIKVPGTGEWQDFDLAQSSSDLEDALNTASWFVPIPAVRAAKVLGEGTRLAQGTLKATRFGSTVAKTKIAPPIIGAKMLGQSAKVIAKKSPGAKGVTTGLAAAAVRGPGRRARGKVKRATTTTGVQAVSKRTGATIERGADDALDPIALAGGKKADHVAQAMDRVITSAAQSVWNRIPTSITGAQAFAYGIGRKSALGGAAGAGGALIPAILDDRGEDEHSIATLIVRDAYDLIVGAVPSGYEAVAAGWEFLHGDSERGDKLVSAFKEASPIWNAVVEDDWEKALQLYQERPISGFLELAGAEYVLGRTAGTALRMAPSAKLKAIGSQNRSLQLGPLDTQASFNRAYSPDIFRKGATRLGETLTPKKLREAEVVDQVLKRTDEEHGVYRNETSRLWHDTTREFTSLHKKARKAGGSIGPDALPFIVGRITRKPETAIEDLRSYRTKLENQLKNKKRQTDNDILTEETINNIDRILDNPEFLRDRKIWDAAEDYIRAESGRQNSLIDVSTLTRTQAEAARWIPYLVNHMGGKYNAQTGKWKITPERTQGGKFGRQSLDLNNHADIQYVINHASKQGVSEPGFFRMQMLTDPVIQGSKGIRGNAAAFNKRTGEAVEYGLFDSSFNGLFSHAMRLNQTVLDADHITNIAELFSPIRRDDGSLRMEKFTKIQSLIKENPQLVGDYIPFNLEVYKAKLAGTRHVGEDPLPDSKTDLGEGTAATLLKALEAATDSRVGQNNSRSTYIAMPKHVIDRLNAHTRVETSLNDNKAMRGLQMITREFKGGVLPFNPRWQFGNIADMSIRLMMDQTGPASYVKGRRILRKLKKQNRPLYNEILDRLGSGYMSEAWMRSYEDLTLQPKITVGRGNRSGTTGTVKKTEQGYQLQVRTLGQMFHDPQAHANMMQRAMIAAKGLGIFAGQVYRGLQEGGFGTARIAERHVRSASFGKEATRYMRQIENNWAESILITPKAIEDVILRLENDSNAVATLGRNVNNVMGDYTRLSPEFRRATMSYAPFALWARASVTWVLALPARHPAKVGLLATLNSATEEDRRLLGLSMLNPQTKGKHATKPEFLRGSIVGNDRIYPTQTLTSFGTLYNPDPSVLFADFILPQISSGILIGRGVHWTGEKLVMPDGSEPGLDEKAGIYISNMLETYFPAAKWYKTIEAEGAPDEVATVFDPTPEDEKGKDRRDVTHTWYGEGFEARPKNALESLFMPVRSYPIEQASDIPMGLRPESSAGIARYMGELSENKEDVSNIFKDDSDKTSSSIFKDNPTSTTTKKKKPKSGSIFK